MPKRKLFVTTGVAIVALAGGLTALGAVIKHEPNFYRQAQMPADSDRRDTALKCVSRFTNMDKARNARNPTWGCVLSDVEVNSFFSVILAEKGDAEKLAKLGISSPSIVFEDDQLRLAFTYNTGWFSTVISYHLKIWLVPKEPNTVAIQFVSARAGALPISSQAVIHQLCDLARTHETKVHLYRHEGNTVAVIQLQPAENHPWWLLTALEVKPGSLSIHGKTLDHALKTPDVGLKAPDIKMPPPTK